jgi:hypothetical protein
MTQSDVVTVAELMTALGKSRATINRMLRHGAIPSYPPGPGYGRITTREMFDEYMAGRYVPPIRPIKQFRPRQSRQAS